MISPNYSPKKAQPVYLTSSLFWHHYQTKGTGHEYPKEFHDLVVKIKNLYNQKEQIPRINSIQIGCDKKIPGANRLPFALKIFLNKGRRELQNLNTLTPEEQELLLNIDALLRVTELLPAMIIKVTDSLELQSTLKNKGYRIFVSSDHFMKCLQEDFQHEENEMLLAVIDNSSIAFPAHIPPELMQMEMVKDNDWLDLQTRLFSDPIPQLPWDTPLILSEKQFDRLCIKNQFSALADYSDSTFSWTQHIDQRGKTVYRVTRQKRTPEDNRQALICEKTKALMQKWLAIFQVDFNEMARLQFSK